MEEALVKAYIGEKKTLSARQGAPKLIRYADDFVVLHAEAVEVLKAQQLIATWLQGIGLELKPSKSRLSHTLNEYQGHVGFNFLGFSLRQYPVGRTHTGTTSNGKPLGFKTLDFAKQRSSPTPFASTQEDITEESIALARATH
jgi:hypothetical protein